LDVFRAAHYIFYLFNLPVFFRLKVYTKAIHKLPSDRQMTNEIAAEEAA